MPADPPGDGFVGPPGERSSARLRLDGRLLLLAGEEPWAPRVRRLAPYASWLQGLPLLHAAAVERQGTALALVGPSGVGKTTLAAGLAGNGFVALHDDLTQSPTAALRSPRREPERRPYQAPRLARWGSLVEVTLKTGASPDMNQSMKMGLG